MSDPLYDASRSARVDRAARRLEATLAEDAPHLATAVLAWLHGLSPGGDLAAYFRHERRFPMLLLPWWMGEAIGAKEDPDFEEDVTCSTMAGYCAIRLLDDTLDQSLPAELLPAVVVLLGEFQQGYVRHFAGDHPFWDLFRRHWYGAADFAADHVAARDFTLRVERRLGPAVIPLAATAYHAGRADMLPAWAGFAGQLARLEQMLDDLTDWAVDAGRGAPNAVLDARAGCALPGEPVEAWVLREGLSHGFDRAEAMIRDLQEAAAPLGSDAAARFLRGRSALLQAMQDEAAPGLQELARLRGVFPSGESGGDSSA